MLSKTAWARAVAVSSAFAILTAAVPAGAAFAQESPSVALEQARRGEDGTTGAGAASGNMESGTAKRDNNGNAETATAGTAGGAGETATADGSSNGSSGGGGGGNGGEEAAPPLPENAELLDALGILDDVTTYGVDVLTDMDIPVELLPPPVEEPAPAAPTDVNTGGQGGSGGSSESISTEPGDGAAPAGGSTSSAAEDGAGATEDGKKADRKAARDAEAAGAIDGADTTDGGTETATATG